MNTLSQTALHDLGMTQLASALAGKQVSAVEVAQHFLARSQAHGALGAYVDIQAETTLAQAAAADARSRDGGRSRERDVR